MSRYAEPTREHALWMADKLAGSDYVQEAAAMLRKWPADPVAPKAEPTAPDGVWEALQRLIENGAHLGPASADDALLVAKYRRQLIAPSPQPVADRSAEAEEAARYRWLRDTSGIDDPIFLNVGSCQDDPGSIDAAIDAAMGTPRQAEPVALSTLTDAEIAEVAERLEASDPTASFWREFAREILALAASAPALQAGQGEPDAWVPIHPRNGPLWSMATDKPDAERLPSYELRALFFAAPTHERAAPAPEPVNSEYERGHAQGRFDEEMAQGPNPWPGEIEVTRDMVDRFLCWKLPADFSPDCGISFDRRGKDAMGYAHQWPVGTNLLTAEQARAMLEHVLASPSQPVAAEGVTCEWHADDDGIWYPGCDGYPWNFTDGGPIDNHVEHCMRCGKKMTVASGSAESKPIRSGFTGSPPKSLLRAPLKPGERLVCYCPPGVCQAPKGFTGPCNRANQG